MSSMYSVWQRLGTFLGYFSTCLAVVLPIIAATSWFLHREVPTVALSVSNITNRLGIEDYYMNKKVMLTDLKVNLEADFKPLFHWNTKQLFLYMTIEYQNDSHGRNQIVFWDRIVRAKDGKRIAIEGLKNKYPAVDVEDQLPGTDAVIKLYWNTVPNVGYLFDTQKGSVAVRIPGHGETFRGY